MFRITEIPINNTKHQKANTKKQRLNEVVVVWMRSSQEEYQMWSRQEE